MLAIGQFNSLRALHTAPQGLYLDGEDQGEILLPKREVASEMRQGSMTNVFIYRDSEDRLVATTKTPLVQVGEIAVLRVVSIHEQIGVFLDWGLPKDLLLPFKEQTHPLRVGQRVLVIVLLDPRSNRIIASRRLESFLPTTPAVYKVGEPVDVIVADFTPLGYSVLIEKRHMGMLYADKRIVRLESGSECKAYVKAVHPSGKIDLSLDASGYKRVVPLANRIIEIMEANNGRLPYNDDTTPEVIREVFGVSKKAFKQALGNLYKTRQIQFSKSGIEFVN